jgi:hypothetical protein
MTSSLDSCGCRQRSQLLIEAMLSLGDRIGGVGCETASMTSRSEEY